MAPDFDGLKQQIAGIATLSPDDIELFCSASRILKLKKGEYLLREGDMCRDIYFINKGFARSFHLVDGNEINTQFHFENSFVTNLKSLRMEVPSEYFISVAEPSHIFQFTKKNIVDIYARSPAIVEFGKKLLEMLLIKQEEHLSLFKIYSAEERYRYIEKNDPALLQRVSLSQLSSYLGVARETLSRFRGMKH